MVRIFLIMIGPALFASLSVANRMHPLVILIAATIFAQFATLYSVTIDSERDSLWMAFQTFYSWLVFALLAAGVSAYSRRGWRT